MNCRNADTSQSDRIDAKTRNSLWPPGLVCEGKDLHTTKAVEYQSRVKRYLGLLFRDRSDLRLLFGGQGYLRRLLGSAGVLHVVRRRLDLAP